MIFWKSSDTTPAQPDRPGETWVSRLGQGLAKSSTKITQDITDIFTKSKLDESTLEQLEEVLIAADLGPKTATRIIEEFSGHRFDENISEKEIRAALAKSIEKILEPAAKPLEVNNKPFVVLVCGVNGVGKTTTIGKMAQSFREQKKSVLLVAGDTFRAAAIEQLGEWARRTGSAFFSKEQNADAAAVAYEAFEKAKQENVDILFIDTAGRLHNKSNLMAELQKITRVLKKHDGSLPHAVLLVLDATTGQNAFEQVRVFKDMIEVTGLAVTKLDGSAKGGVLVGLAGEFNLPVHFIGIGEKAEDLRPFKASDYAHSLMGL